MVHRYDIDKYYQESHSVVRWIERRRLELILIMASPVKGVRLLEVGCGAGHVLERFRELDRTGLDLSPTMLRRARSRVGFGVRLLRGSAEALPFANGSFDIVICTEVLEHTMHPRRVIQEMMRVAARDARVVVSVPNEKNIDCAKRLVRRSPIARTVLRRLAAERNEWHVHRFDAAHLSSVVGGAAVIAQIRAVPFPWFPLRYVALLKPLAQECVPPHEDGESKLHNVN